MNFVKANEVNKGDIVRVDYGFTCMSDGEKVVKQDETGLFLNCLDGKHYLDGQLENGEYIGIYKI